MGMGENGNSKTIPPYLYIKVGGRASSTSEGDSEPGQVGVGIEVRNTAKNRLLVLR